MKLKLLTILTILLCAALITTGCAPPCPDIDSEAPDFTLENVYGESISLSDFKGKTVMVNFWATWCGPCLAEIPHFQAIYDERAGTDLVFLAIDIQESASTVQKFVENNAVTFPVLLDSQAEVAKLYCLPAALPQTLFINNEGTIKERKLGAFQSKEEIERILNSL